MTQHRRKSRMVLLVAVLCLAAGAIAGFLVTRHWMMGAHPSMADTMMMDRPEMSGMNMSMGDTGRGEGAMAIPAGTRQLIGVRIAPAERAALEQEIRTVGAVEYNEEGLTKVNLKVAGWIKEVFVNSIGQPVRRGEPLLTLYSPDLLASQEEYLMAVKTQARLSESPLDDAREGAAAMVASARDRLRLWDLTAQQIDAVRRRGEADPIMTVYAPSAGVVLAREALPGNFVDPGTTLYEVADLSTVWLTADIYESEVAGVTVGQRAMVTFAAYPGEVFQSTVSYIYPSLNATARTIRVRFELPNPDLKFKPGMFGNVTLRSTSAETLVVPKEAVLDTGLRHLVFVEHGEGVYRPTEVRIGRRGHDRIEVLEGLAERDRVVISANFLLDAEAKLRSAAGMHGMMGRIGMGDWQMQGAHEGKMDGM